MDRLLALIAVTFGLALPLADAAAISGPPDCKACFSGPVILEDNDQDPSGRTKILQSDLYFVDAAGLVWEADKGDITDGASIPALLQPVVGNAFENDFLPAAVIHDHYTTKAHYVRTWTATALMFYQAMLVKDVPAVKAKTMYYAVYTFGPHWAELVPGHICGKNCINVAADRNKPATKFVFEAATYDAAGRAPELAAVEAIIKASELQGQPMSIDDLNTVAKQKHPGDEFIDPPTAPNSQ